MIFFLLLIIPLFVALGFLLFGGRKITILEFFIHVAIQLVIVAISCACIFFANTGDIEILNGAVVGKDSERIHCRHSYPCNPHNCMCDDDGCSTCYDTCYEHSYDISWNVYSNIPHTFEIDTIDRQGLKEPPRWTRVYVGEPVSIPHFYVNYVKASSDSLFRYSGQLEKFSDILPNYPGQVYDYYKLDRLVTVGYSPNDFALWNSDLMVLNSILGPTKQANVIILLSKNVSNDYFYAVKQHWLGGKKNDIVVFIDVDDSLNIHWVRVMSWSDDELFDVKLRDDLLDLKTLDRASAIHIITSDVSKYFKRKSMSNFKYLMMSIVPKWWQLLIAFLLGIISSIIVGYILLTNTEVENNRRH